jgi:hypothetical protein
MEIQRPSRSRREEEPGAGCGDPGPNHRGGRGHRGTWAIPPHLVVGAE